MFLTGFFLVPAPYSCKATSRHFILQLYSGSLASYNYPLPFDEYEPIKCSWQFKISSDYKIKMSFDSFDLPDSKDCSEDRVEVNRQKFCGSRKPFTVTLHDSERLTFRSSGKRRYPGFKATYSSESECSFCCYSKSSPIVLSLRYTSD